jgi:hypothetical protein
MLRSFSSSVPLEDYAHGVRLPEKWMETRDYELQLVVPTCDANSFCLCS